MKIFLLTILFILVIFNLTYTEKTVPGLYFSQDIGASINPLGAEADSKIYYRFPFIDSDDILWSSTRIDVGLINSISPAFDGLSAFISIAPIAVFNMTVSYGFISDFKALGFGLRQLGSYTDNYNNSAFFAIQQQDCQGSWLNVEPVAQVQVGPWIAVNDFTYQYWSMHTPSYYYSSINDMVLNNNDSYLANNDYLFYQFTPDIMAGINNMIAMAPSSSQFKERLSLTGVYSRTFWKGFDAYGVIMAGTFLADPNYRYLPYIALQLGLNKRLM